MCGSHTPFHSRGDSRAAGADTRPWADAYLARGNTILRRDQDAGNLTSNPHINKILDLE